MRAHEFAQGLRHREGEQEMRPGQLALELALQPRLSLVVLAAWTMPVAAGAGDDMGLTAGQAVIQRGSGLLAAAALDGADHLLVIVGHRLGKARKVVRRVLTK